MPEEIFKKFEQGLKGLIEKFKLEVVSVRTNRPNIELLENLEINCYDQIMTLKQVGSVSFQPPREIQISLWDKDILGAVVKAIENSRMGFTPSVDGQLIRINIPSLSLERRVELGKLVKKMTDEERIKVRGSRDGVNKELSKLAKDGKISEDQEFRFKERVQKVVDFTNSELEEILNKKIKDLND